MSEITRRKLKRYSYIIQLDECSGEIPRGFRNRQWVRITVTPAKRPKVIRGHC